MQNQRQERCVSAVPGEGPIRTPPALGSPSLSKQPDCNTSSESSSLSFFFVLGHKNYPGTSYFSISLLLSDSPVLNESTAAIQPPKQ